MPMPPLADVAATVTARYGHIRHKRHALRLGGISFPSKSAARELIQALKAAAPLEQQLPDEFTPLLLGILDWHPSRAEKLQYGCRGFMVRINPPAFKETDRGFWIIADRPPPALISFSYIRCFQGSDSTPMERLTQAARAATISSQLEFKRAAFLPSMLCPRNCGTILTPDNAHVDHVAPKFRDIVRAFVGLYGMPPQTALAHQPTYGWRFTNPADAAFFAAFHDKHSDIRELVCATCNMTAERNR